MKKAVQFLVTLIFLILALLVLSRNFKNRQTENFSSIQGQMILAAGDIGDCTPKVTAATETAKLLGKFSQSPILTLGDNAYPDGTKEDFETCFNLTWGKYKNRIFPAIGNHEYHTKNAMPYFDYFGKRAGEPGKGYYSFNLGNWHLIAVNTQFMDDRKRLRELSEEMEWLKNDLEQNKTDCTLIYGHHPRFSSSSPNASLGVAPLLELAYSENVDVILNGHAHFYERFSPQDPQGNYDPKKGIRQFIVGTGGGELGGPSNIVRNSEVFNNTKHGVLKLILGKGQYEWEFLSTDGAFVDKGVSVCH